MENRDSVNNGPLTGQRSCNVPGMKSRSMTDKAKEWLNTGRARVTVYLSGSNLREGRQADDQVRTEKQVTAANLCFNSQSNSNQVLLSVLKSSGY